MKCKYGCEKNFKKLSLLLNHYRWEHKKNIKYECICGKLCSDISTFTIHKNHCDGTGCKSYKNKIKWIVCPKCKYEIKRNRKKHLNSCDGTGPKRVKKGKFYGKGNGWAKGLTYEEINELNAEKRREQVKNNVWYKPSPEKEIIRRNKISIAAKKNMHGNYGGYKKGSGRGKHGWYKGYWCDSSWELAYVIYNLEHNIKFERNTKKFKYIFEEKQHHYIPDFKHNNKYVEIKGYWTKQFDEKMKQFPYKLKIIDKEKIKLYIEYVKNKYGKEFIKLYD